MTGLVGYIDSRRDRDAERRMPGKFLIEHLRAISHIRMEKIDNI